ncbi:hypothetical protein QAD02_021516 [Eretmocerus hayati]|uniref:Uncharacterized protein n=1 Tax=Eretmocerus hayati TaxID=131215 RepID=A0ACC2PRU4_9HYME|nr:hypothetical protein QAD02_021516 [Eretmocerus hayati]
MSLRNVHSRSGIQYSESTSMNVTHILQCPVVSAGASRGSGLKTNLMKSSSRNSRYCGIRQSRDANSQDELTPSSPRFAIQYSESTNTTKAHIIQYPAVTLGSSDGRKSYHVSRLSKRYGSKGSIVVFHSNYAHSNAPGEKAVDVPPAIPMGGDANIRLSMSILVAQYRIRSPRV